MRYLSKTLVFSAAVFFLVGCSAIDRVIHPAAKSSPTEEPAIEQAQKEESQPTPPSEPTVMVPVEPFLPPSPPSPEIPAATPAPVLRVTEVVWVSVNLREGPGMGHKIMGTVKKGTSVAILEDKGQWFHVRLEDGKEAWIFKSATVVSSKPPSSGDPSKPKPVSKPKPM